MFTPLSLSLVLVGVAGLWLSGVSVMLGMLYAYGERQQQLRQTTGLK